MALTSEFETLALEDLRREAAVMKADGWRFVQTHAVNTDDGVDLYYSFMKDGGVLNYRIEGVTADDEVPSITDLFLAAFVFENEARELFGVNMTGIAIDFQGAMYAPAEAAPMTFISPEQKAAREKARKAAAAKEAKEVKGAQGGEGAAPKTASGKRVFVMTDELRARLDAKMPTLSDEKKAKVEAALKAREAEAKAAAESPAGAAAGGEDAREADAPKAAPGKRGRASEAEAGKPQAAALPSEPEDPAVEALLAGMDAAKATKVRAALGGEAGDPDAANDAFADVGRGADAQVEQLLAGMGREKAAKVIEALSSKGGE